MMMNLRLMSHLKKTSSSLLNVKNFSVHNYIDVLPEVSFALSSRTPVVALESTIITHGMPYPQNYETAISVQNAIKEQGATPATIAVIGGRIKVGLAENAIKELAVKEDVAVKTSRRDFPYVISKGLDGGTTVSGTIIVANTVGINIFATGGIGGVHRNGEVTMDISTDLTELGRNPVTVVSSGVKSILDIPKTLEYLETQGVCVATYGPTTDFPSFYSCNSSSESPFNVETPLEAASLIYSLLKLELKSGILIAVPIPEGNSMPEHEIESAIQQAIIEAESQGVFGKEVTPYILSRVSDLTSGRSLEANIALIENNGRVAAQIAVELQKLKNGDAVHSFKTSQGNIISPERQQTSGSSPVVIGGSVLDSTVAVKEDSIQTDGSTHRGEIRQSCGGVGRNIADALGKLGMPPIFISAVGDDQYGQHLLNTSLSHVDTRGVHIFEQERTASYTVLLDKHGECQYGVGDMDIHNKITPQIVQNYLSELQTCPLVVMDGNIPQNTIEYTLEVCESSKTPVWFEPTDIKKASLPFSARLLKSVTLVSPNFNELKTIAHHLGVPTDMKLNISKSDSDLVIKETLRLSHALEDYVRIVITTLGKLGVMITRKGCSNDPVLQYDSTDCQLTSRLYKVPEIFPVVTSVSGAGDCLASGFIAAMLLGLPEDMCVSVGFMAAHMSLNSSSAVPGTLFNVENVAKHLEPALYINL